MQCAAVDFKTKTPHEVGSSAAERRLSTLGVPSPVTPCASMRCSRAESSERLVADASAAAAVDAPDAAFGTFTEQDRLSRVAERAQAVAGQLADAGLARGDVETCVAKILRSCGAVDFGGCMLGEIEGNSV